MLFVYIFKSQNFMIYDLYLPFTNYCINPSNKFFKFKYIKDKRKHAVKRNTKTGALV